MNAPILITVYDRLEHLKKCIDSLKLNKLAKETDLYVVSDAPYCKEHTERIEKVREYLSSVDGFRSVNVFAWETNKGAVKSCQDAMQRVFLQHNSLIFMEDDCQVATVFLSYMNSAMEKYVNEQDVFAICGYMYPEMECQLNSTILRCSFVQHYSAYGVGIWKDKYNLFYSQYKDGASTNDETYRQYKKENPGGAYNIIRMKRKKDWFGDTLINFYLFKHKFVCLFPERTLVINNGYDGSGVHCTSVDERYLKQSINVTNPDFDLPKKIVVDEILYNKIKNRRKYPFWRKWKTFLYDCKIELKIRMRKLISK